jgi:hypothetical protein
VVEVDRMSNHCLGEAVAFGSFRSISHFSSLP